MRAGGFQGWIEFDGSVITVRKFWRLRGSLRRPASVRLDAVSGVLLGKNRLGMGELRIEAAAAAANAGAERASGAFWAWLTDRTAMTFLPWQAAAFAEIYAAIETAIRALDTGSDGPAPQDED